MTLHIFGAIMTGNGCAANNRGETDGNITTLQKLLWHGQVHSTVSAEAIRWALRYYWQMTGLPVNRKWDDSKNDNTWQDPAWAGWAKEQKETYLDDDLLGYMSAEAAKVEGAGEPEKVEGTEEPENKSNGEANDNKTKPKKTKKPKKEKGTTLVRRGVLELSRAISTTPYAGDVSFNSKSGEKGRTSLYGTEMHCTRYQYGFAMTPDRLDSKARCLEALDAIVCLGEVAGNHSRFLFDFAPESIILRITDDPAPRILYCFEEQDGQVLVSELIRKVIAGDIDPQELYLGGQIAAHPKVQELKAKVCDTGVKRAVESCKAAIREKLQLKG